MRNEQEATLEDLIFETLRRARSLVKALDKGAFICSAKDGAFISRCLSELEAGRVLDDNVEGALNAIRRILCKEIEKETIETRPVFDGYHDPEIGDVGSVIEIPVRTVRGDDLAELFAQLDRLSEARNAAIDRLRAEKEVRKRI